MCYAVSLKFVSHITNVALFLLTHANNHIAPKDY